VKSWFAQNARIGVNRGKVNHIGAFPVGDHVARAAHRGVGRRFEHKRVSSRATRQAVSTQAAGQDVLIVIARKSVVALSPEQRAAFLVSTFRR
jgi:hypothetical protein